MNKIRIGFFFLLVIFILPACAQNPAIEPGIHEAEITGGKIWYHVVGNGENTPILMLHGGPGGTSYSFYALSALADDYTLVILDQPGTGRSGNLQDTAKMKIDLFVDQLHEFVQKIGLKKYIVYGHSWGTMLALDYYLKYPAGIQAIIMNSPLVSTDMWMKDAKILVGTLDEKYQEIIRQSDSSGTYNTPEYREAMRAYYRKYISRGSGVPGPDSIKRVAGNSLMYNYMWGPSEFKSTGTLRNYDRLDELDKLDVPVLWVTGEYDEARPETVAYYHQLDKDSEFKVIPDAAHGTMHDNQKENIRVIREFLHKYGF